MLPLMRHEARFVLLHMRTRILPLLLLLVASINAMAQMPTSRLSTNVMMWLHNETIAPAKNNSAIVHRAQGVDYLSAFVKVANTIDKAQLDALGVIVGTRAGNIWTVRIPKDNMIAFASLVGIDYIELDRPVKQAMDSARVYANVDSVSRGIGLNLPYTGKGVVVGIVDGGFDYTHPTFYDTTYSYLRIKRVWNQAIDGTPPAGYTYGAEFADTTSILNQAFDDTLQGSHGIMVGSIAAGSGLGSPNGRLHRGVAYEADLVMITGPTTYLDWRALNMTTIIDGFNYTFDYAASVGKPAVINVSMGSNLGPRDGTSLFSQACDNLTGAGKILVFGAMNLGGSKTHVGKSLSEADTILSTLIPNLEVDDGEFKNYVDVWGDAGKTFCLRFSMYKNGSVTNSSVLYCLDDDVKDIVLVGSDGDTCLITLATKQQENNNKPHAAFEVLTKSGDTLMVSAVATSGTVHMWQEYFDESWNTYYGEFLGGTNGLIDGDDNLTIGEMNCTRSAITVGATVSRRFWRTINNVTYSNPNYTAPGTIAYYSSRGPDIEGRMKPDIAAPGGMIACATSSFDSSRLPGGGQYSALTLSRFLSPVNNRTYYYAAGQGTSLASPVVAGIVALMLQVNPSLSPQSVKDILYRTAIKDNFTTPTPDPAVWGAGKVNAYAAVKEVISTVGVDAVSAHDVRISVYPNPTTREFTLEYESTISGNFLVEVSDVTGRTVLSKLFPVSDGTNRLHVQLDASARGMYFVHVVGNRGMSTKMVGLQ